MSINGSFGCDEPSMERHPASNTSKETARPNILFIVTPDDVELDRIDLLMFDTQLQYN